MPSRKVEPHADDEADPGGFRRLMRAHQPGELLRSVIAIAWWPSAAARPHQLVGMRGAAQEREIAGDLQLGVGGQTSSGKDAMDEPARRRPL